MCTSRTCEQSVLVGFEVRDVLAEAVYRFRPVVHLRTGGVTAIQVLAGAATDGEHPRPQTAIPERAVRMDVGFAAEALRRAHRHGVLQPLHLTLWAETLCVEQDPLAPLLDTIAELGREPRQVVIRPLVLPGRPAPADLDAGLRRLRVAGLRLGLDAAGTHPLMAVIDARPEVLHLAAQHAGGLPDSSRARSALAGASTLAAQSGATLVADGCERPEQAAALRAQGVYQVQGRLLGPTRDVPRTQPIPAAVLERRIAGPLPEQTRRATGGTAGVVADLAHPASTLPLDATGETARAVFAQQSGLTGLVLVDEGRHPLLALNRDRFMLAITGPFGHALHARRPAAGLAERPRTLHLQASLTEAVDLVADSPAAHIHDDIVLTDHDGRCQGVLRVQDLVRDLAQRQDRPPALAHC